jgi:predicted DNA-binding protein (MmcQ/YjbR family)
VIRETDEADLDERGLEVIRRLDSITNHIYIITDAGTGDERADPSYPNESRALEECRRLVEDIRTAYYMHAKYGSDCYEREDYPHDTIDELLDG